MAGDGSAGYRDFGMRTILRIDDPLTGGTTGGRRRGAPRAGRRVLVLTAAFAVGLAACGSAGPSKASGSDHRLDVVASFFPVAFAATEVGGDRVAVRDLAPAGAEPHDLELDTGQADAVLDADLVFVMGGNFQPAVERVAEDRGGETVAILDAPTVIAGQRRAVREAKVRAERADARDPHIWLDPVLMSDMVDVVEDAFVKADPAGAPTYRTNAAALRVRLAALDDDYSRGLAPCLRRTIVTTHEAFGWLAPRYSLQEEGIAGLSPDAEPGASRIADLTDLVRSDGITTIFTEDAVPPKLAQTLAREAGGLRTEVLSPLETLTDAQVARRDDYFTVMRTNLQKLQTALACRAASATP